MILTTALLLALQVPQGALGTSAPGAAGLGGGPADIEDALGLVPLVPTPGRSGAVVTLLGSPGPGAVMLEIQNTGTGYAETFYLQVPQAPSRSAPSPLLVAFHRYGSTGTDVLNSTEFEEACWARNWMLVIPLGASDKSFSSLMSQANTELVIELVLERFAGFVDTDRIYGVGFSMGGSNAMNYAARHVDPTRPMFAAIVNHSGPASLALSYDMQPNSQPFMEYWFGGSPEDVPFAFARSSVLDAFEVEEPPMFPRWGPACPEAAEAEEAVCPVEVAEAACPAAGGGGLPVDPPPVLGAREDSSLALNLTHVPILCTRASGEPSENIVTQMDLLVQFLARRKAPVVFDVVPNIVMHQWATLDEDVALDWLGQFRRQLPTRARTLADRDDRYFHFTVEQAAPGAFSPLSWGVDGSANRIYAVGVENTRHLTVHTGDAGLEPSRELFVGVESRDGTLEAVLLRDFPSAPEAVFLDGRLTSDFVYDAATGTLSLSSSGLGRHRWRVVPTN